MNIMNVCLSSFWDVVNCSKRLHQILKKAQFFQLTNKALCLLCNATGASSIQWIYFQELQFSKLLSLLPKAILFYCEITTFLHVNKKWPFSQNPVACWVCFCPWRLLFWFPCFPMCISSLRPFSSVRTIFRIRSERIPLRGPVSHQYLIGAPISIANH